jgi:hypothetical protein
VAVEAFRDGRWENGIVWFTVDSVAISQRLLP